MNIKNNKLLQIFLLISNFLYFLLVSLPLILGFFGIGLYSDFITTRYPFIMIGLMIIFIFSLFMIDYKRYKKFYLPFAILNIPFTILQLIWLLGALV